jgi:hypothetical protein
MRLVVIDGRPISSGLVEEEVKARLVIDGHEEEIMWDVVDLGRYPLVLGLPWLRKHDPHVRWQENRVVFSSNYCSTHCLPKPIMVQGVAEDKPRWLKPVVEEEEDEDGVFLRSEGAFPMAEVLATNEPSSPLDRVPLHYQQFAKVFSKGESEKLPPHRPYDFRVELMEGKPLPKPGGVIPMNQHQLKELKEYLDKQERKGYIRKSKSPVAAPCFFIKKADGSNRLVIDYRRLNEITV